MARIAASQDGVTISATNRVRAATGSGAGRLGTGGKVPGSLAIMTMIVGGPRMTTLIVANIVKMGVITATAIVSSTCKQCYWKRHSQESLHVPSLTLSTGI